MIQKFTSHLKVDRNIVSLLSKSTYQKSFSSTIRELISNAYDADALSVKINFDSNFSYIEIEDDGNGMTKEEFEKYLTIAGTKQTNQFSRKYRRKRIGQFGVGFLSIFPFCESLEIITTSENSTEILKASIPTKSYFESGIFKSKEDVNVEDIPINGSINKVASEKLEHYTKIKLLKPTALVKQYFTKPNTRKIDSIFTWRPLERFKWELQEELPISLRKESKYFSKYKYDEPIGINVYINDKELFRNDYLEYVLEEGTAQFGKITCKYIFTTDYKSLKPLEQRGVKLRVNNVGIGARTDFSLKRDRGFSRLHWITGEIFISEQIKEHLNIGRDGFISNPQTDEIFEYFSAKLRDVANEVETIAVAEKDLGNVSNKTRSDATKPKTEIISASLKKLENKGYKVVEETSGKTDSKKPIRVDKKNKVVYVTKKTEEYKETLEVLGKEFEIRYDKWDVTGPSPACRKISRNIIEINQNYPLFKSKSLGNVFKRFHILLLIASEKTNSSKQLFELLNEKLLSEFEDFI